MTSKGGFRKEADPEKRTQHEVASTLLRILYAISVVVKPTPLFSLLIHSKQPKRPSATRIRPWSTTLVRSEIFPSPHNESSLKHGNQMFQITLRLTESFQMNT